MGAGEGVQARQQPAGREGADDPDLQLFAEPAFAILVERRGDAVEHLAEDRNEGLTLVGEGDAAWQPVEQARAEAAFELGDVVGLTGAIRRWAEDPALRDRLRRGIKPVRTIEDEIVDLLAAYRAAATRAAA